LTEISAPDWDPEKKKFYVTFETLQSDNDRGHTYNVSSLMPFRFSDLHSCSFYFQALNLGEEELERREIVSIDIADNSQLNSKVGFFLRKFMRLMMRLMFFNFSKCNA
jgi:hypothetical protein